jgi:peptidoglycan/xylan/chitin deacetylase (PgdA/CDA1 family)
MWSIISYDYEKISPEQCYKNVTKHLKNGSIVLFHDNLKAEANVKYALANTLKHYTALGYRFEPIVF